MKKQIKIRKIEIVPFSQETFSLYSSLSDENTQMICKRFLLKKIMIR